MSNIAAAANLAELGRRIRTARTKLHWSQEAFAGVCGLERAISVRPSAASEMSPLRGCLKSPEISTLTVRA